AHAGRRLPHLPRARPPLGRPGRDPAGHEDDRPGRELPRAVAGGQPRHLALPLPRRAAHDGRDDRPLPGEPMIGRALSVVVVAGALALPAAAAADTTDVGISSGAFGPMQVSVLAGDTVAWQN